MYILDTNVVSELRNASRGRANPNVVDWASRIPSSAQFLSAVTIFEIELGVVLMERRDARQGAALRRWLERKIIPTFGARVLDIDTAVARRCAGLHVPDKQSERDAMIAATALVHSMSVVTRNVADFDQVGVQVINPWRETAPS